MPKVSETLSVTAEAALLINVFLSPNSSANNSEGMSAISRESLKNFQIFNNNFIYLHIYNIQIQYIHRKFIHQKLGILKENLLLFITK